MAERSTVIGVFEDPRMAQQAIQELKRTGFSNEQIGFVLRNHDATEDDTTTGEAQKVAKERAGDIARGIVGGVIGAADLLLLPVIGPSPAANALETALPAAEEVIDTIRGTSDSDHEAKEGTVSNEAKGGQKDREEIAHEIRVDEEVGAVSGGVMGGVLGAASALSIPGIGPVIAGGILIAALAGAAIGAVSGGYLSAFTNIGVPEKKVDHYRREFEAGHIIVTVKTNGREQEVVDLLRRNGAHDVQTHHTF